MLGAVDFDGIVSLGTIPRVHNGLDMTAGCNFWGGFREVCLVPYRMDTMPVLFFTEAANRRNDADTMHSIQNLSSVCTKYILLLF